MVATGLAGIAQCDALEALFQAGTPEHLRYRDRMLFVSKALRANAQSGAKASVEDVA
ncbi:MAG: hypothetical protein KJ587_08865 [Alphaproteobacteria bacterium]|nr:hypothetical protein [Alphaproteobacteria bacterium]